MHTQHKACIWPLANCSSIRCQALHKKDAAPFGLDVLVVLTVYTLLLLLLQANVVIGTKPELSHLSGTLLTVTAAVMLILDFLVCIST